MEILAPAGNLEKLKTAVNYGAHAVYLAGPQFGLRYASDNFSNEELSEGVQYAHIRGAKVYVVINSFFHNGDFIGLQEFLDFLAYLKIDAVIVSDLGVVDFILKNSPLIVHLSTQASCLNRYSALFWKKKGVKRLVLGREVSIKEAAEIKKFANIEVELFIHGSMCMAYSGHCVISNYTQGRDSNRGGCAHSCRFEYALDFPQENSAQSAFVMSSKDLSGIDVLKDFYSSGIDSAKIEGRMKGPHYVSTVTKAYVTALENLKNHKSFDRSKQELMKITHRDYTKGSLIQAAGKESVFDERLHKESEYQVIGIIRDFYEGYLFMEVRAPFKAPLSIEVMAFKGGNINIKLDSIQDIYGEIYPQARPGLLIRIPYEKSLDKRSLVRLCPNEEVIL